MKTYGLLTLWMAALLAQNAAGQDRLLAVEDIVGPDRLSFGGSRPSVRWLDNHHYLRKERGEDWTKVEAETGKRSSYVKGENLRRAFSQLSGFSAKDSEAASKSSFKLSPDGKSFLIDFKKDLYHYTIEPGALKRISFDPLPESETEFSPDGRMVSFVRSSDLYLVDLQTGRETRLTSDGSETLLNGRLDWVYQEEIYGRGNFKGYWWSPDSTQLAYLQIDQQPVPSYSIVDHLGVHPDVAVMRYPKAGDPNPTIRLGVISANGGETHWVDASRYASKEHLIVQVSWSPEGELYYQVQDRDQTWLSLDKADPASGKTTRLIVEETSKTWVDVLGEPFWLKNGNFLWRSQRSGWQHIYLYNRDGVLEKPITTGQWAVRHLYGIDAQGWVYFSGTRDSHRETQLYRTRDNQIERLSENGFSHSARFNSNLSLYIDSFSALRSPPQTNLHKNNGDLLHRVYQDQERLLDQFQLGKAEFLQVKTRDGFEMEALLIRPPDFDPSRKYPVISYAYSGPQAPQVQNRWRGDRFLWHEMLAQMGYLVWICDNRSASGKGVQSAWPVYRNFGELELKDLEDGLDWLSTQAYVDSSRIGLWGWSFGGYMTAYALTHSPRFKIGISVAPVTDWSLYDSVYTERYMGRPQDNQEGYQKSSVLEAASNLRGRLLLIHGTTDDNVHLQNSVQLVSALQKAGKQFDLMLYPDSRHGIEDESRRLHLFQLMTRFVTDHL